MSENGLAINGLIAEIVNSRISAFAWLDVVVFGSPDKPSQVVRH